MKCPWRSETYISEVDKNLYYTDFGNCYGLDCPFFGYYSRRCKRADRYGGYKPPYTSPQIAEKEEKDNDKTGA
jgi:hypothetical protein